MQKISNSMNKSLDLKSAGQGTEFKIFVRDVRDRQGRKRPIALRSWSTIKDIKNVLQQMLHVPPSAQLLYFGPLMTSGGELPNHWTLQDAGIHRSGETVLLDIKNTKNNDYDCASAPLSSLRSTASSDVCLSSSMIDATPKHLRHTVQQARRGFSMGLKPELVMDGSGGTYFLHDARKIKVAVFKPADEEPYADNNPRGYVKQGGDIGSLREGIGPGEACLREVAAFLLDHNAFSGVPMTTLAEARHPAFNTNGSMLKLSEGGAALGSHSITTNKQSPLTLPQKKKVGSFQEFVKAECSMDDISPSMISVEEVHKIAILDIRIMNADRNSANLLCRRRQDDTIELIPIDHGYSLRTVCDVSWMDWCWLDWPQLKQPLSEESKKHVLSLDIDSEARRLKEYLNIPDEALDYFRASSKLLQAGVKAGLSLYDIAVMCCRNDNAGEIPSKLEVLTAMASELATSAAQNARWGHSAASRAIADQLSPGGGSLFTSPSNNYNSPKMFKSQSSAQLQSFLSISTAELDENHGEEPTMAQSSASESSSDIGDELTQKEECDEWAAAVIADVSMTTMEISTPICHSESIEESSQCSDESGSEHLSSSPVGFWHIRPGSASDDESDDEDVSWSPRSSPRLAVFSSVASKFKHLDALAPPAFIGKESEGFKSPTVTFGNGLGLPPPATVNVSVFKRASIDSGKTTGLTTMRKTNGLLGRSKSYSTLSEVGGAVLASSLAPVARESEQFRAYFAKFVDLVIVRETTAASSIEA